MPLHTTSDPIDPVVARALVRAGWSPSLIEADNTLRSALKKATSIQSPLDDTYNWEPAPLSDLFPLWSDVEALTNTATSLKERYTCLAQMAASLGGHLAHINTLLDLDPYTYGFLTEEALTRHRLLDAAMRNAREARRIAEEAQEKANAAKAEWEEAFDNLRRTPSLTSQLRTYWEESLEALK
jgi:hypothetical protein